MPSDIAYLNATFSKYQLCNANNVKCCLTPHSHLQRPISAVSRDYKVTFTFSRKIVMAKCSPSTSPCGQHTNLCTNH